jgi:HSP20 family protein
MDAIVRRTPRELLRREFGWPFDRFLEDLFEGFEPEPGMPTLWHDHHGLEIEFMPPIDMTETPDAVVLTVEVPGITREDLQVSIENGILTLRGQKREEEREEGEQWHRFERRYGRFERHLRLPEYVDPERVEARYENGVLRLQLPKTKEGKERRIEIK